MGASPLNSLDANYELLLAARALIKDVDRFYVPAGSSPIPISIVEAMNRLMAAVDNFK
jgi:hypothetical protein